MAKRRKTGGRTAKLTPEIQKILVDGVAAGVPRVFATQRAGVDDSTVRRWVIRGRREKAGIYHTFFTALKKAEADAVTSDDLLAYLPDRLPAADVPCVVVLDNAGIHTSKAVKAARPELARLGIYLYYLPPYSPGLNRIEPVFKQVKHHNMPTRSFTTKADLRKAVEDGFESYRRRLQAKCDNELRLAA